MKAYFIVNEEKTHVLNWRLHKWEAIAEVEKMPLAYIDNFVLSSGEASRKVIGNIFKLGKEDTRFPFANKNDKFFLRKREINIFG